MWCWGWCGACRTVYMTRGGGWCGACRGTNTSFRLRPVTAHLQDALSAAYRIGGREAAQAVFDAACEEELR